MKIENIKRKKFHGKNSYTRQEKILLPIFHLILVVFAIWAMLPVYLALINSVKPLDAYYSSPMGLPTALQFSNYANALTITYRNNNILQMFVNTMIFVVTFLFANMFSSICTAYVLSKFKFFGRNFLYGLAIVIQIIPIYGTQTAAYMFCDRIGLVDNIWFLWITAANGFDYTFLIVFSYFENIDKNYFEAAKMDGAGNFVIFAKIMVPMVMPSILVMGLSNVIGLWNDYSTALLFLPTHPTIGTGIYALYDLASRITDGPVIYFAAIIISIIPVTLVYIFTQKAIFKISLEGGLKG